MYVLDCIPGFRSLKLCAKLGLNHLPIFLHRNLHGPLLALYDRRLTAGIFERVDQREENNGEEEDLVVENADQSETETEREELDVPKLIR